MGNNGDRFSNYMTNLYIHVFNPYVTSELSYPYHLGEPTLISMGVRGIFLFHCSKNVLLANSIDPD